jgi:hypothetical protein
VTAEEGDRLCPGSTARDRDAQRAIGLHAQDVAARAPHADELDAFLDGPRRLRRLGCLLALQERKIQLHGLEGF